MSRLIVRFTFNGQNYDFRRPTLGNSDNIALQRVKRTTRGGDIIVFRDPEWPKTETLGLTFDFADESEATAMRAFIRRVIGQVITYTDHESVVWTGVIQNPDAEIRQTGLNSWVIQVIFEGDQV